jgi:hypothetical protein
MRVCASSRARRALLRPGPARACGPAGRAGWRHARAAAQAGSCCYRRAARAGTEGEGRCSFCRGA